MQQHNFEGVDQMETQAQLSARQAHLARSASSFLIRPSPAARKEKSTLDDADRLRRLRAEEIEREFLEIDMLTDNKLREIAKRDDLENVTELALRVDTTDQSITQLGRALPSLKSLTLDLSILASFRDFGTSLRHLRVLHLASSQVRDLDGISALDSLVELHIAGNYICDLTPLAMHESLETLDLRGNLVRDLNEIDQLGTCLHLRNLLLEDNPVARIEPFRRVVCQYIPHLEVLESRMITKEDREPVNENVLENLSAYLETLDAPNLSDQEFAEEPTMRRWASACIINTNCDELEMIRARPSTPLGKTKSLRLSYSPKDATRNKANVERSEHRVNPSQDSSSASKSTVAAAAAAAGESASDLTHGSTVVFAGNLAASMRRRKKQSRLESNEQRLREVAAALANDSWGVAQPEQDLTPRFGSRAEEDDDLLLSESKLDELLALSNSLERDFRELQLDKGGSPTESPRSRIVRRKARAKPNQMTELTGKQPHPPKRSSPLSSVVDDLAQFAIDDSQEYDRCLDDEEKR